MESATIDQIMAATARIPYGGKDGDTLIEYLKMSHGKGYDITINPIMLGREQEAFADGIILLSSYMLNYNFVILSVNRGKGLFGRQKRTFMTYFGPCEMNDYTPGPSFNNLLLALTSINNIFRDQARSF